MFKGLDYSRFAVFVNASEAASTSWVERLLAMLGTEHLASMQRELQRAAQSFRYARRDCGTPHCDVFSIVRGVVVRAWNVTRALQKAPGALSMDAKPRFRVVTKAQRLHAITGRLSRYRARPGSSRRRRE